MLEKQTMLMLRGLNLTSVNFDPSVALVLSGRRSGGSLVGCTKKNRPAPILL